MSAFDWYPFGSGAPVEIGDRVRHAGSGRLGTVTGWTEPNPFYPNLPTLPLVLIDGTDRPQIIAQRFLSPAGPEPNVADVPPHLRGAVSPERWAEMSAETEPADD